MKQKGESRRRFDYERRLLPSRYLESIEGKEVTELGDIGEGPQSIGYPAWNLLYYSLFCSILPEQEDIVVVETGTNHGFSTIVMAQALKDLGTRAVVETVELREANVGIARGHVEAAGLSELVRFHHSDAIEFLTDLAARVDHIDFIMLDDGHGRDHVLQEIDIVCPLVSACAGKIYFDNTKRGGVAEALQVLSERFGGNLIRFNNCSWFPPGNAIWQPSPV